MNRDVYPGWDVQETPVGLRLERDGCVLYRGDCLEVLPTLEGVDAVVTDPPYGVQFSGSATKHSARAGRSYSSFEDTPESIAKICVPAMRMAMSMAKCGVMTPGSACGHLYDRPRAQGAIFYPSGANFGPWGFACSQPLFYYGDDPYLAKGLGCRPNGFSTTERAEENGHPCPKPIGQTMWMVNRVAFEGETVLDPFMGSGTTGVAAIRCGMRFVGIEQEPAYFDICVNRIMEALLAERSSLFPAREAPKQVELF